MKKVIFALFLLSFTFSCVAQNKDNIEKKIKLGFNIGANYSNILYKADLPSFASVKNAPGIQIGLISEMKVNEFIYFSPKIELVFNNGKVEFNKPDVDFQPYLIEDARINIATHLLLKKPKGIARPYLFTGPNLKIPISKPKLPNQSPSSFDLAIDFGIGLDKKFTKFNFSPELRYSFGLRNINQNPLIRDITYHNIAIIFNFLG